jgi:hypothetical protein
MVKNLNPTDKGGRSMGQITLRPELMTAGGQAASIMLDDGYVGTFTAIYRESDTLFGLIQLDKERLGMGKKELVDQFMREYVQDMAHSLDVEQCTVMVTYSVLSHVLRNDDHEALEEDQEVYVDIEDNDDYNLVIEWVHEEIDALILDVYEEDEEESLYIGRATVNIGDQNMTVLIEFDHPRHRQLRERLAYHLVELLEDEFDFETITLTMQYNDEVIDEYHFDYADQINEDDVMEEEEGPRVIN